jgi:YggT family protein
MLSFLFLIDQIIGLYMWCLIIVVAMSWLTSFNIINTQNRVVSQIYDFMYRITEPVLSPIRRWVPNFGGIDISPVILILLLVFLRNLIKEYSNNLL